MVGDLWGRIGYSFSGAWYGPGSQSYVDTVKSHYNAQDRLASNF
jgi:hypothetical protein